MKYEFEIASLKQLVKGKEQKIQILSKAKSPSELLKIKEANEDEDDDEADDKIQEEEEVEE